MKILDKTKSLSTLASSTTNGLGNINPISCIVTEELNGIYEAEFQVSTNDKYYPLLKQNGLVKIKVGDNSEQIFRIYSISEPINFIVTCKCQHITYDLSKIIITPFTATGAVNVKNQLLSNVLGTYPFTMTTDISNTTSTFDLNIPRSWRECLGGYEGSLLDVFRGEYEYDNLTVKMLARRGADNGVRIAYGKNLTDFQQEQNNENVFDAVYGYAVVDDVCYEASSIYNKTGATVPRVLRVDFSNKYESGDVPTGAELLAYATTYATDNDIEVPSVNIKISFIPLWQTDEYKSILQIERVKLGDTVHVYFEKLGVTASARVIKTVWNSLTEKYDSVELGDARANLNTVINQAVDDGVSVALEDLDVDVGWLDDKITNMAELIANGMGLHITIDSAGRIYLHNADTLAGSQYQYEITSNGFMMSDDYGQTWNSGWDISGNAVTNSLSTITLKALEIYGSYIEGSQILFGDHNDKYILAQVYNDGVDNIGVTFDGTGYVRFQPQGSFVIDNLNANSNILNEYLMVGDNTTNKMILENHNFTYPSVMANRVALGSSASSNYLSIRNYKNDSVEKYANGIYMSQNSTSSSIAIDNYHYENGTQLSVNSLSLRSLGSGVDIGSMVSLVNRKYENGSTTNTNSLLMKSDMSTRLWSGNDMKIRSTGAVRIYADLDENSDTGDYNDNHNANKQDIYLGGYSVKIQAESGGRIYLYWGSTRYYLGTATISGTRVVTATAA